MSHVAESIALTEPLACRGLCSHSPAPGPGLLLLVDLAVELLQVAITLCRGHAAAQFVCSTVSSREAVSICVQQLAHLVVHWVPRSCCFSPTKPTELSGCIIGCAEDAEGLRLWTGRAGTWAPIALSSKGQTQCLAESLLNTNVIDHLAECACPCPPVMNQSLSPTTTSLSSHQAAPACSTTIHRLLTVCSFSTASLTQRQSRCHCRIPDCIGVCHSCFLFHPPDLAWRSSATAGGLITSIRRLPGRGRRLCQHRARRVSDVSHNRCRAGMLCP